MDGIQSFPEIVKLLIENGLQATLTLFFLTLIFGLILGMIIAKGRMSKLLIIQMPIRFFLLIMRGTPLILQLYGFYFGLYYVAGLSLDRMTAAVISFSLNYAAYFAEIYRSGIQAIPKGQYEAAKVLGFNRSQTFFKIILPQVVKIITPSLGSECMTLVKDTSLAHVSAACQQSASRLKCENYETQRKRGEQESSRGHKFSILENFLPLWDSFLLGRACPKPCQERVRQTGIYQDLCTFMKDMIVISTITRYIPPLVHAVSVRIPSFIPPFAMIKAFCKDKTATSASVILIIRSSKSRELSFFLDLRK